MSSKETGIPDRWSGSIKLDVVQVCQKIGRRQGKLDAWKTGSFENVGVENLKQTIERFTGLYLSI